VVEANGYTHEQVNTELGVPDEHIVTSPRRELLQACGVTESP